MDDGPPSPDLVIGSFTDHGPWVVEPEKIDEVMRTLAELPEPPPSVRRVQLWSNPVAAFGLITLLSVFWIGRKAVGLV